MNKRKRPSTPAWFTLLLLSLTSFLWLGGDQPIANGQGSERRFTGLAVWLSPRSGYIPMRAGEAITGGAIIESSAELIFNEQTGAVTVTIRKVADLNITFTGCNQRETITISLTGTYDSRTRRFTSGPGKSSEARNYTIWSAPDMSKCSRSGVITIDDWWAEFEDERTIAIYTSLKYPEKSVAVTRVTSADPGAKSECDRLLNRAKLFTDSIPEQMQRLTQLEQEFEKNFGSSHEGNYRARRITTQIEDAESSLRAAENSRQDMLREMIRLNCYQVLKSLPEYHRRNTKILAVSGANFVIRQGSGETIDVKPGEELPFNYYILSHEQIPGQIRNELTLQLPDNSVVVVSERTQMTDLYYKMMLDDGEIKAQIKPPLPPPVMEENCQICQREFTVQTPTATIRTRRSYLTRHHASTNQAGGSVFTVRYDRKTKTTKVIVTEGQVRIIPADTSVELIALSANQQTEIGANSSGTVSSSGGSGPAGIGGAIGAGGSSVKGGGNFQWVGIGAGDCGGNDTGQIVGTRLPEASSCNAGALGTIAVCWDGNTYSNPSRAGQWCTYKNRAANPCRGGSNPGQVYECRAGTRKPPPDDIVLSPTPASTTTWATQANQLSGQPGQRFTLICPPGEITGRLWGTGLYTNDSSVCTAAVHAGLITPAAGGRITVELREGAASYTGTTRSGVTSKDYGAWSGSFIVVGATRFPKDEYTIDTANPFMGTWDGGSTWGDLVLRQQGRNVTGTYSCCGAGTIQGIANGNSLRFTWTRSDGNGGEAFLSLKSDGSFEGKWCFGKGCDPGGASPFTAKRR